jgi:hypothetical protein
MHIVHMMHQFREEAKPMSLSANEQTIVTARLQAAGIPVLLKDQSAIKPDLMVESLKRGRAFDLKMGSEFLLNLRISSQSYVNLKISKVQGHLLEANWGLTLQGDPKEHDPDRKMYRMLSGSRVRYKSVLNHRLRDEIAPGGSIEGKLLALSVTMRIPKEYPHGLSVPLEVILTDQYGRQFASIIEVSVDRTATMSKPEVFDRVGRGLYEGSPPAPEFDLRVPSQVPVGKADTGESGEKQSEWMKKLADCIAYVAKVESDSMLAEVTSTRDMGELDATGEPTDLFEEDARCRYLELLAHEKNAEQRRVAEIVDKK